MRDNVNEKHIISNAVVMQTILSWVACSWGFPGGRVVKNPPANAGDARKVSLIPGSGRFPWRRKCQPTPVAPVFLPGKFPGQRTLAGYSLWGHKELATSEQLSIHTASC